MPPSYEEVTGTASSLYDEVPSEARHRYEEVPDNDSDTASEEIQVCMRLYFISKFWEWQNLICHYDLS